MAINELIASGIKLPQFNLPDYGADMAQMAQIQNARNQNALAQYQLGAAQRAEAKDVARTNALMAAGPDEDAIAQAFLESGDIKGYFDFLKAKEERKKIDLEIKKSESALLSDEINRAADAMAKAPTIEAYEVIHNKVHDPKTRTGKYFQSIGFDPSSSNQTILEAKNDPTGQKFLQLRALSGLKGKEFADRIFEMGQAQELQAGGNTRAVPAAPTQIGPGQPNVPINALSSQNAVPTQNAMIGPVGVPPAAALPTVAPLAAAPSAAAPQSRIDFVKSEINRISNVLNTSPGNKLASDRLKALTDEYNQLSAEQGREATLKEAIRAAGVREKLDQAKYDLEIDKFNASQKEFKVEKTPQGLVQINKDGTVDPILGADGKQVQSLEFAKSEFKVNADGNYIAFNPYTNESRIVTGADGKPVRSLDAATKAEQERHNRELERQGVIKIGQENKRIALENERIGVAREDKRGSNENTLRDEYNSLTKDFRAVQDAHTKITTASPTGAGDMSLLYNYVKLLDPTSVVRESEFAAAAASGSFGERVQGAVNRVLTGQRLTENLRKDFVNEANNLYKSQQIGAERIKSQYLGMAERAGLNPKNVIVDYAAPAAEPPKPSAPAKKVDIGSLPPKVVKNGVTYILQPNGNYIEK